MDFFVDDSKTGIYRQKKTRSSQWIGLLQVYWFGFFEVVIKSP